MKRWRKWGGSLLHTVLIIATLATFIVPASPVTGASGISAFYYVKKITFNTTATGANVSSNQSNFPIIVEINSSSWNTSSERSHFFGDWNVNGKRCQFFDTDNTTNLAYEVESYNATTQTAIYHVKVPLVTGNSSTDYIWVAYGNDPNAADQDQPTSVWDANYLAVYHMNDDTAGGVVDYGFHSVIINGYQWARVVKDGNNRYIVRANFAGTVEVCAADSNWQVTSVISTSSFTVTDLRARMYPELNDHIIYGGIKTGTPGITWTYNITSDTWASNTSMFGASGGWIEPGAYYNGRFYTCPLASDVADPLWNTIISCTPGNWTTPANWTTYNMSTPQFSTSGLEPAPFLFNNYLYILRHYPTTYQWDLLKWDFGSNETLVDQNTDNTSAPTSVLISLGGAIDGTIATVALPYYNGGSPYWSIRYTTNGSTWLSVANSTIPGNTGHENFGIATPYDATHILVQNLNEYGSGNSTMYATNGTLLHSWFDDSHSADLDAYFVQDGTRMVLSGQRTEGNVPIHYITHNEDNASTKIIDSTSHSYNGTKTEAGSPVEVAAVVGKGQSFSGNNLIALPNLGTNDTVTFEAWSNVSSIPAANNWGVVGSATWVAGKFEFGTLRSDASHVKFQWDVYSEISPTSNGTMVASTAYYLAGTYDKVGTSQKLFIDGALDTTITSGQTWYTVSMTNANIGDYFTRKYQGVIDEVRISNIVRSEDWIKLTYNSQLKSSYLGDSWITLDAEISNIPTINTLGAVTASTSANVSGNITDMGAATTANVSFEWGLTSSYGNTTANQTANTTGTFTANISGLVANTLYHYRFVVYSDTGTVNGTDGNFTTSNALPVINTSTATATKTSANVSGNITNLGSMTTANVSFEWGLTVGYGSTTPNQTANTTGTFTANISGLAANTLYHYRFVVYSDVGTVNGTDGNFTTTNYTLPSINTLTAIAAATSANVSGNITNMGDATTANVSFEYGLTGAYGNTTANQTANTTGTFTANISGLAAATLYHYRFVVYSNVGTVNGSDGNFTTGVTLPTVNTLGAIASNVSSNISGNITNMGTATTSNVSFVYGLTSSYGNTTANQTANATGTYSFNVTGLTPYTLYHYKFIVVSDAGSVNGTDQTFTTTAVTPTASTSTATTAETSANVTGNISAMGDATTANVTFQYGLTVSYGSASAIQATNTTGTFTANLTGLSPGTLYHFRIAVASNVGTVYGADGNFTTNGTVPTQAIDDLTGLEQTMNITPIVLWVSAVVAMSMSFYVGLKTASPTSYIGIGIGLVLMAVAVMFFPIILNAIEVIRQLP